MSTRPKPVVLTILDGWGYSPALQGNAISASRKPNYDQLLASFPHTLIATSGPAVGLPKGQMGNSEVGHLNIGAGRIIRMDITRLDVMVEEGTLGTHPVVAETLRKAAGARLHLLGLVSDGGVHSMNTHLYGLLEAAKQAGLTDVCVHCFMDGRDTPPQSGHGYLVELQQKMNAIGVGRIATVVGRYYAMDRDKRWERVARGYAAMVNGVGVQTNDPLAAVEQAYAAGTTDEFLEPIVNPGGTIQSGDSCLFFNFRADRAREISLALNGRAGEFGDFPNPPAHLHFATMTQYDKSFSFPFVLEPEQHKNILADVLAANGLTNLRTAETEKYAHVTYFFNGGNEKVYPGESRELIASPKVATYDLQPEMSAPAVADVVVKAIETGSADVIIVNFANPDMVGHSGMLEPTIKAIETVDTCLGRIWAALSKKDGAWLITADHGNAETMVDEKTGQPFTYHTTNPVPFLFVQNGAKCDLRQDGSLRDIAPTILALLGVEKPAEMTGSDLRIL